MLVPAVVARARDQQDPCSRLDSAGGIRSGNVGRGHVGREQRQSVLQTGLHETAGGSTQLMISEAANEGQEITRKQVRRLTDEFTAATSPLFPRKFVSALRKICFPPRSWHRW